MPGRDMPLYEDCGEASSWTPDLRLPHRDAEGDIVQIKADRLYVYEKSADKWKVSDHLRGPWSRVQDRPVEWRTPSRTLEWAANTGHELEDELGNTYRVRTAGGQWFIERTLSSLNEQCWSPTNCWPVLLRPVPPADWETWEL